MSSSAPQPGSGLEQRLQSRRWRLLLYAVVIGLLATSYCFKLLPGVADALFDYFLYLSVATTFTPIPTVPAIILAATKVTPGMPGLALVAVIGAAGTTVAYLIEYAALRRVMHLGGARKLKRSRVYLWLSRLFRRAPFTALSVAAFLPIPIDGARLLAISEGYRTGRYAMAAFIGRVPRYWLIAALGQNVNWSTLFGYLRRLDGRHGVTLMGLDLGLAGLFGLVAVAGLLVWGVTFGVRRHRRSNGLVATVLLGLGTALVLGGSGAAEAADEMPVASAPTAATSPALQRELARLDQAVAGLVDAQAGFRQQLWSPIFEDTEHSAGQLWYRAPGDLVLRYRKPEHQEVFIDTAGVWIYLVEQKQAQRHGFAAAAERDGSLAILWRPSSELAKLYDLELTPAPPVGEKDGVWLQLIPRSEELTQVVNAIYLRLSPQTGLSDCILVERTNGERVRLEVHDFKLNPNLDDTQLRFTPDPDVDTIHFDQ